MRRSEPGRDGLRGRNTHRLTLWGALAAILSLAVALSAPDAPDRRARVGPLGEGHQQPDPLGAV